ncbi:universal stress protein [Halobacterium noricense]|uniref:universal stress protein n=1 Tax=Halobacterium noricense TaxID=223182 RepID=UPI001E52526F|nr:universal stress protein [Halobacterium noricense]UHH25739.1 universal stress protein [Halobacterium noricense]
MSAQTLLVPVVFPDPDVYPLDDGNIVGLSGFDVVLFGYWELPEGVSPETGRAANEADAQAVLYEMAAQFSRGGASTSVQLHFGRPGAAEAALQDRIAESTDADAVLAGGHITMWTNVLVPLRDARRRDEVVTFLSGLDVDSLFTLELFHAASDRGEIDAATETLESVKAALVERGFAADAVDVTVEVHEDAGRAIAERAQRHNLVVMGETQELPDDAKFLGPVSQAVLDRADTPVVVLRE